MSDRNKEYLAHISDDRTQTVVEHLEGTAALCGEFAAAFGCREQGEAVGSMHDVGKCSDEFQQRLLGGKIVDHATAGALEYARLDMVWASLCIIGHHGGLPDFGNKMDGDDSPTMMGRLKRAIQNGIPKYESPFKAYPVPPPPGYEKDRLTDSFIIRMLYSCLVDADYLDTEAFMLGGSSVRSKGESMIALRDKLSEFIKPWFPPKNELNRLRCSILKSCIQKGEGNRGLYSLTVPTGGGKTIASLAFALNHAVKNGLDRVIYVIPYTSIIEQTAEVFRNVLGENNVLEHHSGSVVDVPEGESTQTQFNALVAENWDAPVIVTTAVRFFESLYANRSSACRKLHNIANSVIIFDEYEIIGLNLKSQLNQGFRGLVLFLLTLKIADKAIHRRQYAQNRNLSAERGAASLCSASTRHTLPTYISFRRSTELSACVDLHRVPLRHSTHVPVARAA